MGFTKTVTVDLPVPVYPLKLEEILGVASFLDEFAGDVAGAFISQMEQQQHLGKPVTDQQREERVTNLRAILGGFFLGEPYSIDTQLKMLGDFVSFGEAIRQEHGDALVQILRDYEQQRQEAISAIERPFAVPSDSRSAVRKDDIELVFQNLGTIDAGQIPIVQRARQRLEQWADSLGYLLKRGLEDMKPFSNDCRFIPVEQLRAYSPPSVASLLVLPDFYPGGLDERLAGNGKRQVEGDQHAPLLAALYRSAFLGLYAWDKFFDWSFFPSLREEFLSYRVPHFDATVLKIRTSMASGAAGAFLVGRLMGEVGATGIESAAEPIIIEGIGRNGVSLVQGRFQGKDALAVVFNETALRAQGFDGPSIEALIKQHQLTFAHRPSPQPAEERETTDDYTITQFYLSPDRLYADGSSEEKIDFSRLAGPGARLAEHWYRLAQAQRQFPGHDVARIIGRNPLRVWLAKNSDGLSASERRAPEGSKTGLQRCAAPENKDPLALFGGAHVEEQVGATVWRIRAQQKGEPVTCYVDVFPSAADRDRSLELIKHYEQYGLAGRASSQSSEIARKQVLIASSLGPETLDELLTFLHWRQGIEQQERRKQDLQAAEYALLAQFARKVGSFLAYSPKEHVASSPSLRTIDDYLKKFEDRFLAFVSQEGFTLSGEERKILLSAQRELASVYTAGPIVMKTDRTPRNEVVDAKGKLHSIDFKDPCTYVPLGAAVADAFGFSWYITNGRTVPFDKLQQYLGPSSSSGESGGALPIEREGLISLKDFCVLACFLEYQSHAPEERRVPFEKFTRHYWAAAPQRAFNSTATAQDIYAHRGEFTYVARFIEQTRMEEGIETMRIGQQFFEGRAVPALSAAIGIHQSILDQHIERYGRIPTAVILNS